jgi:hypothetical protein
LHWGRRNRRRGAARRAADDDAPGAEMMPMHRRLVCGGRRRTAQAIPSLVSRTSTGAEELHGPAARAARAARAVRVDSGAISPFCQRRRCRTRPSQPTESLPDRLRSPLGGFGRHAIILAHGRHRLAQRR